LVYDVIIAGAGPVGLFLACELRLAKLSVRVLEQAEDPSPSSPAPIAPTDGDGHRARCLPCAWARIADSSRT